MAMLEFSFSPNPKIFHFYTEYFKLELMLKPTISKKMMTF